MTLTPDLIALLVQVLLRYGPDVASALSKLLHSAGPTDADWQALFLLAAKPYTVYAPLPPAA